MKNLRALIRYIIQEESRPQRTPHEGLALTVKSLSSSATAVIYDKTGLLTVLDDILFSSQDSPGTLKDLAQMITDKGIIKGFVEVGIPAGGEGNCNDAWEVSMSAGPGYGGILYPVAFGIAAWNGKTLMSDRGGSSPAARGRWGKEATQGRKSHPFDDIRDPKTPPPEDDCIMQGDPILDSSYEPSEGDRDIFERLRGAHIQIYRDIESRFSKYGPKEVEKLKRHVQNVLLKSSNSFWSLHRPR